MAQNDWQPPPTGQPRDNARVFGQATRAYAAASAHRSIREQEADVFRRTSAVLRRVSAKGGRAKVKALADNRRLWSATIDLLNDPLNPLPADLRAAIVSVGQAVIRDLNTGEPDFDFLISVNENIADGLFQRPQRP